MKPTARGLVSLALAGVAILAVVAAGAAQDAPSGTVEITSKTAALGFGGSRGDGTLTLQDGSTHQISVEGLKMAALGVSAVQITGTVYNLNRLRDLEGTYTAGEAGIAIVGGVDGMAMKNDQGVVLYLRATQLGLNITLALGGIYIRVKSHLF